MNRYLSIIFVAGLLFQSGVQAIPLAGSNGRVVDFVGVYEARPNGLVVLEQSGGNQMTLPWNMLDLENLRSNYPDIYSAYAEAVQTGKAVAARKGIYAEMKTYDEVLLDMAVAFKTKIKAPVPTYQVWLNEFGNEDGSYYSATNLDRRRERVYQDYKTFLDEFFGRAVKVTPRSGFRSVNVSEESVEIDTYGIVSYLAGEDRRSRNECLYYLNENPAILEIGITTMESILGQVPNELFDKSNSEHNRLTFTLDRCLKRLREFREVKTFALKAQREFEDLNTLLVKIEPTYIAMKKEEAAEAAILAAAEELASKEDRKNRRGPPMKVTQNDKPEPKADEDIEPGFLDPPTVSDGGGSGNSDGPTTVAPRAPEKRVAPPIPQENGRPVFDF